MRNLLPFAAACAVALILNIPFRMPGDDRTAKPNAALETRIRAFEQDNPRVALLGDSILGEGVDEDIFCSRSGLRTKKIWTGGAASAWWYLTIKNVICVSSRKPEVVIIFFRDHYLTYPSFRVSGPFESMIKAAATSDEPLLDRLAYHRGAREGNDRLAGWLPMVARRETVRSWFTEGIKNGVSLLVRRDVDYDLQVVFGRQKMDQDLFGKAQLNIELQDEEREHVFAQDLDRSFLVSMIALLKKENIGIVFVRCKRRRDLNEGQEPDWIVRYVKDLGAFLAAKGIPFHDFTHDERIKDDWYADADHFGDQGRTQFTRILVEALQTELEGIKSNSDHGSGRRQ